MKKQQKKRGRPATLTMNSVVAITGDKTQSRLQQFSLRRRVVDVILEKGGRARVGDLQDEFKFDVVPTIHGLLGAGWLAITDAEPIERGKVDDES